MRAARTLPLRDYLIGLGSNSQGAYWLPWALQQLQGGPGPVCHSQAAMTPDGVSGGSADYLNAAAIVRTHWPAWRLERWLKALEAQSGRSAAAKAAGTISLDLDLLGRRRDGQAWRWRPRRLRDLHADYLQPHLAELQVHLPSR